MMEWTASMKMHFLRVILVLVLGIGLAAMGCGEPAEPADAQQSAPDVVVGAEPGVYADAVDGAHADHQAPRQVVIADRSEAGELFSDGEAANFVFDRPFRQVSWMLSTESPDALTYRTRTDTGQWSDWAPLEITWSESPLHNARIIAAAPHTELEVRGGEVLDFAQIEFYEEIRARRERLDTQAIRPEAVPEDSETASVGVQRQAVAPAELVTSRHEWDAFDPDRICNNVIEPYRMTLHHTAGPTSEGGDSAARMRQIQDFHINEREWCDIGYHFVVDHYGEIFQGRSRSDRPGAHVGGQNAGNVGVSMIGTFTTVDPPQSQIDGVVDIMTWAHETHGIPLNRDAVRGHREWPGASTQCPGDRGLDHLDDIVGEIDEERPPSGQFDVDLAIQIDGLDDFYTQGTSDGVVDAFSGQQFTAELRITNLSTEPIRDVELAYEFDELTAVATDYRIESDHPEYDQSSWTLNDADEAPENPASNALGASGVLTLYAFSPGETKRVVVDMETVQYNIGAGSFAGLRTWVQNIRDVYEGEHGYGEQPSVDWIGDLLQAHRRVDVLSRDEWQFQAGERDDREGWTAHGDYAELIVNDNHDALAQNISGEQAYLLAPEWTEIDADRFDEMVLRVRAHDGEHHRTLFWAGADQDFDAERSVHFQSPGDGDFHTLVVPLGEHPDWRGDIDRIQLGVTVDDVPGEEDSGWYDVAHIYFQERDTGETTSVTTGVVDEAPVTAETGDDGDGTGSQQPPTTESVQIFPGADPGQGGTIETNPGCSATDQSPAPWWLLLVILLTYAALAATRTNRARPAN